jgi:hypothetical protein
MSVRLDQRLLPAVLLLACTPALARPPVEEPDNLLNDRFSLQAALVGSSNSTNIRLDSTTGTTGTGVAAESDLHLPKRKVLGLGEFAFRMHERHRMRLAAYYVPLDRTATVVLTKPITFGDTTYGAGESVHSELGVRVLALTYTYSFIRTPRLEVGGSFGLDVIGFSARATSVTRLRTESSDRSAPAPLVGVDATGRLSSRFYLDGRFEYLKANVSGVRGNFRRYEADLLYRLHPNVTVGLGYSGLSIDVNATNISGGRHGRVDLKTTGPQLFARVGF